VKLGLRHKGENIDRIFESRVLRRILGPKRDGVVGGWRKLYIKELHNFYYQPNIFIMTN
jgi:hypothetical protein